MENASTAVETHRNKIQTASGTVASVGLELIGKKIAGALVTPATWTLNYAATGNSPEAMDGLIYGTGFISAPAAAAAGLIKAAVDDDIDSKLREARATDNQKYSAFFTPCYRYASAPPQINAMSIANKGGTAWKHPNGLWIYITDAKGQLVCDFTPRLYTQMYRPKQPLQQGSNGGFAWHIVKP